ncbi:MAG TPA: hypothetical protein VK088_07005 [Acidimicrobiia bacterium]|nr:hypothetical protein [Acidimicrobiia bacterium]
MKRLSLFAAWLGVLVLATTLTWQIVSAADDRVSDRPLAPLNVAAPVITGIDTTPSTTPASIPPATEATDPEPSSSTTSSPSTTVPTTSSSPSTTQATSTTTALAAWQTRSVETRGGTVVFRYRPGEVIYQTATPAAGYRVEVDKQGPPEVEIEFESEEDKVEIHAAWESGDIDIEISGSSEDDDD